MRFIVLILTLTLDAALQRAHGVISKMLYVSVVRARTLSRRASEDNLICAILPRHMMQVGTFLHDF
ncbi:MAG: hypothetical protein AAYR33_08225 [Acetobacteraceae bacterium]